jgi:hypothetical protein
VPLRIALDAVVTTHRYVERAASIGVKRLRAFGMGEPGHGVAVYGPGSCGDVGPIGIRSESEKDGMGSLRVEVGVLSENHLVTFHKRRVRNFSSCHGFTLPMA